MPRAGSLLDTILFGSPSRRNFSEQAVRFWRFGGCRVPEHFRGRAAFLPADARFRDLELAASPGQRGRGRLREHGRARRAEHAAALADRGSDRHDFDPLARTAHSLRARCDCSHPRAPGRRLDRTAAVGRNDAALNARLQADLAMGPPGSRAPARRAVKRSRRGCEHAARLGRCLATDDARGVRDAPSAHDCSERTMLFARVPGVEREPTHEL
jgi:hypothetical protein